MNSDDKVSKNRQARGFELPQTKLTPENIEEIKNMYSETKPTHQKLAEIYNVSRSLISRIIRSR